MTPPSSSIVRGMGDRLLASPTEDAGVSNVRWRLGEWRAALERADKARDWVMFALHPLRDSSSLTLRAAAKQAGISPASLSLAERGDLNLSADVVERLLNVYSAAHADR